MKKLYEKGELGFSIIWIIVYCVIMSVADSISAETGINSIVSLPVALIMSGVLLFFIKKNGLAKNTAFVSLRHRLKKCYIIYRSHFCF